jgi:thioredoxin-dependent adenylylsulfate APS reductase
MTEPLAAEASAAIDDLEARRLANTFEQQEPEHALRWAISRFAPRLALATSLQVEGMVLLDMLWRIDPDVRVFTVDTGRLPQETYDLIDSVRERYGRPVEIFSPEAGELERFVGEHGPNPFYRSLELRVGCCEIRKVAPLARALADLDAWITGQRRAHQTTRRGIGVVERDIAHGGMVKLNPLAAWSDEQVWGYVRAHGLPYNALYDQGFTSIGCAPCTRATRPGDDPRSGRWWWETDAPKECGMHCVVDWNSLRA